VPGTADQTPARPSEVDAETTATEPTAEQPSTEQTDEQTAAEPAAEQPATTQAGDEGQPPLLPRRTPGANEMPGKPIEQTDSGGGWFTKGSDKS
jgi:hypothetical protein